jgi:hypothetical protein
MLLKIYSRVYICQGLRSQAEVDARLAAQAKPDPTAAQFVEVPIAGERYTLTAPALTSKTVLLNGATMTAAADGSLPAIKGQAVKAGSLSIAPASITFVTMPTAGNASCQ